MRRFVSVLVFAALPLIFAACSVLGGGDGVSGDPDRLLVLGGGDFTERQFRTEVQKSFDTSFTTEALCASIAGLTPEAAADVITAAQVDEGIEIVRA